MNNWDTLAKVRERYRRENAEADEVTRKKFGMRKEPRYTVRGVPATFVLDGQELPVGLRNISLSGASLTDLPASVAPGQSGVLTARLSPFGMLIVLCDIVHCSKNEGQPVVGVRFTMVDQDDTNRILLFLHHQWEEAMTQEGKTVPVETW